VTAVSRLNLVSDIADRELDAIRQTIEVFERASGLDDVITAIRGHAVADKRVDLVDLIGHSRGDGCLVIGTWAIDDTAQTGASFNLLLRPWLERLGVRTIRLLGCSTGTTMQGRNVMRRIARAARCEVFGTKRHVTTRDYCATGFANDACIAQLTRSRSETRDQSI
jgi:hypothetical protein